MDLLGGYDSDDTSSVASSNAVASAVPLPVEAPKKILTSTTTVTATTSSTIDAAIATAKNRRPSKKGKKLLHLQAVLPQHIWNQLTKDVKDFDDDEDDDDDEKGAAAPKKRQQTNKAASSTPAVASSSTAGNNSDLLGLLQALPKSSSSKLKSTPVVSSIQNSDVVDGSEHAETPSTKEIKPKKPPTSSSIAQEGGLGAAFLTSTVQVTRRSTTQAPTVRSIHVTSNNNNNNNNNNNDDDDDDDEANPAMPKRSSQQRAPVPMPVARRSLPRPAAPMAFRATLPPPPAPRAPYGGGGGGSMAAMNYPVPDAYHQQQAASAAYPPQQPSQVVASKKPKSRKKQMEALLRAGKLDDVTVDSQLEGSVNFYQAPNAASAAANADSQSHGVRVVPTTSYNVSTGQMSVGANITGKQRGKNQLNALMANAASLEADRRENPHLNMDRGKIFKANAKRKYGW